MINRTDKTSVDQERPAEKYGENVKDSLHAKPAEDSYQSSAADQEIGRITEFLKRNGKAILSSSELEAYSGKSFTVLEPFSVYNLSQNKVMGRWFPVIVDNKCVELLDFLPRDDGSYDYFGSFTPSTLEEINALLSQGKDFYLEVRDSETGGAPEHRIVPADHTDSNEHIPSGVDCSGLDQVLLVIET